MRTAFFLGCLLLCSCGAIKKTAGPSGTDLYTGAHEWPVKINDGWLAAKTISYGAYTTSSRRNGIAANTPVAFVKDPRNAFNFSVKSNNEQIQVQTLNAPRIAFSARPLPAWIAGEPANAPLFYTLINGIQSDPLARWELILKNPDYLELNENKPAGILRSPDEDIRITAHTRFGTLNSYEHVCYEFQYRGQPVAAVLPDARPRVWMSSGLPEDKQKILAAAIGALLLR